MPSNLKNILATLALAALQPGCKPKDTTLSSLAAVLLPKSGSEVKYEPQKWNDGAKIQLHTNCYAYSLNLQKNPLTGRQFPTQADGFALQPGDLSGMTLDLEALADPNGEAIIRAVKADTKALGGVFVPITQAAKAPKGTYKVALVIAPNLDYHWYRQDPDGNWSHKPGANTVRNVDGADQIIIDPQTANRSSGPKTYYKWFVGYFVVKKMSAEVSHQRTFEAEQITTSPSLEDIRTTLTLNSFDKVIAGLSLEQTRKLVGTPHSQVGSGIVSDVYTLKDGSSVAISYGFQRDVVSKLVHTTLEGHDVDLL